MNLPNFLVLEQTGKDKGLPLFTCHASFKTVNARIGWMNEISLKTRRDSRIFHSSTAKKKLRRASALCGV